MTSTQAATAESRRSGGPTAVTAATTMAQGSSPVGALPQRQL